MKHYRYFATESAHALAKPSIVRPAVAYVADSDKVYYYNGQGIIQEQGFILGIGILGTSTL